MTVPDQICSSVEHVWSPTLMPPAFGLQEQFDEGGVE